MTNSSLQLEIQQLRLKNVQRVMESILMVITALFVTALLPSLLLRYVYTSEQLLTQPRALEIIPVVSFVIAIAYFLYVLLTNIARERRIAGLEKDALNMYSNDASADVTASELVELEAMVEQALGETTVEKTSRPVRKTTKSRTRRTRK